MQNGQNEPIEPGASGGGSPSAQAASRIPAGVLAAPALTATASARLAASNSREPLARSGALERRVDLADDLAEQPVDRLKLIVGYGLAQLPQGGREELRKLDLQAEIAGGQIAELVQEIVELDIGDSGKLAGRFSAGVGEEGAREALLGGSALDAAAALRLSTRAARTRIVATDACDGRDARELGGRKSRLGQ